MLEDIQKIILNAIEQASLIRIQAIPQSGSSIKKTVWKPVILPKKGLYWNKIETHPTKDLTFTYPLKEGYSLLWEEISHHYRSLMIFEEDVHWQIIYQKKGKINIKKHRPQKKEQAQWEHNRSKKSLIEAKNARYLYALGLSHSTGKITQSGKDKFKQINHILRLLQPILHQYEKKINIMDMGAGKGYLSFALYDYLLQETKKPTIHAIELREELVESGNTLAQNIGFNNLCFESKTIMEANLDQVNIVLALHACDTATDDAILKGIQNDVDHIIVAPCCHKELRKHWKVKQANEVNQFLLKHNIYQERQAEMLTDGIRALLLEYAGYDTQVIDFISTDHTPKNVLIMASKKKRFTKKPSSQWTELAALKKLYHIDSYYLEEQLKHQAGF